ncbi:SMI1/KNR4 family protein [Deinococcus roseus]|nr:SMI1/KNR4 family protein [Deinococcus roseus]
MDCTTVIQALMESEHPEGYPEGTTLDEIQAFSTHTGIVFPPEWIAWLLNVNGAFVGGQFLTGINTKNSLTIELVFQRHPLWKTKKYIPVAGDGLGNFYVIVTQQEYGSGHPVCFMDRECGPQKPTFLVASRFSIFITQWIKKETTKESFWPFDPTTTARVDPDLLNFSGIDLPWSK